MNKVILLTLFSMFMIACAVGPYKFERLEEIAGSRISGGVAKFHFYIVDATAMEGQSKSPFRIGVWLLNDDIPYRKVSIDEIVISLNGKAIEGVNFYNVRSGEEITVPGDVSSVNEAPCCSFMMISSELPFSHKEGDRLDISIRVTTNSTNNSNASISFKATNNKVFIRFFSFV